MKTRLAVRKIEGEPLAKLPYKRCRKAGHIIDVKEFENMARDMPIRRLDSENYVVVSTGEILPYQKALNRANNLQTVRKSIDEVGAIINENYVGAIWESWVTLTYRENMTDPVRLRKDREAFWKRLKRAHPDIPLEYVSIAEPQERGAWHLHELWKRTDGKRLYIPQRELLELWGQGGVNIKRLQGVDNLGAYISAYLQNIPADQDQAGTKAFRKGARLHLYPAKMNFYRYSRGIRKPEWQTLDIETKAAIESASPNYRSVIEVIDDKSERVQTILHTQYNMKRQGAKVTPK